MSDDTSAGESQADATAQPQAGTAEVQATDAQQQPQIDPVALQRELQEARREAAKYRTEKQSLERWKAEREQAEMTETEKLQRQLAEAQQREADRQREVQTIRFQSAVETTAARLGFANPSLASRLVPESSVEWDDAGKPTNVDRLLTDLLAAEPYLAPTKRVGTVDGGARPQTETNVQPGYDRLLHAYTNNESS